MKQVDSWSHTSWVVNDERLVKNFCQSVNEIPTRRKKIKRKPVVNLFALHANANVMRIKKCYENFLMKNRSLSQISYFMFRITFSSPTVAHNQMALLQNFWKRGPTCLIAFQNWLLKLNLLNHIFAIWLSFWPTSISEFGYWREIVFYHESFIRSSL